MVHKGFSLHLLKWHHNFQNIWHEHYCKDYQDNRNDKLDINDCNSAAVREMSKVLGVTMEQLVDKYDFLTGTEGEYLGVKYKWTRDEDDHQVLLLNDNGCDLLVWKGRLLIDVNRIDSYMAIVRLMVEELILQNESKALLVEARRKYARTPAI